MISRAMASISFNLLFYHGGIGIFFSNAAYPSHLDSYARLLWSNDS